MSPDGIHRAAGLRRFFVVALAAGLLVAACSGAAATATPAPTPTPPPTAAPTKGPAMQSLALSGPAGAAGSVTNAAIRCNFPSTGGLQITVLGQPADPNLSVFVFVSQGNVSVRYDSGSGATYVERDFAGTGVSSFDASKGATIDTQLTEVSTTDAHGSLGVLTALSGSIDCGNQMPGSSTLTITGPTAKATLSGGLDPVNVECISNTSNGSSVSITGVAQVAGTPTISIISVSPNAFTVYVPGAGFFRNTATAVATLTATGAHVDGDAVEQNLAAGTTAHTVHVTGDAVCGTTIKG
jgi:hypothetical protein